MVLFVEFPIVFVEFESVFIEFIRSFIEWRQAGQQPSIRAPLKFISLFINDVNLHKMRVCRAHIVFPKGGFTSWGGHSLFVKLFFAIQTHLYDVLRPFGGYFHL